MFKQLFQAARRLAIRLRTGRKWAGRTLVVGPSQPVDGDSVGCTKALISFLRKLGLEAYTLPTVTMYDQLEWILEPSDIHPAALSFTNNNMTSQDLQGAYDALIKVWRPDEIVVVDGRVERMGFDPRGVRTYTIDHHLSKSEAEADNERCYIKAAPAAGCLLAEKFGVFEPILAVSVLTDTFWLRQHWPAHAVRTLALLTMHGLTDQLLEDYQRKLMVRKDPAIVQALMSSYMRMSEDRTAVFVIMRESDPELHRGIMGELGYFFRHIACARGDGYVSMRTVDPALDLRILSRQYESFGSAGGHENQAAIQFRDAKDVVKQKLCDSFFAFVAGQNR